MQKVVDFLGTYFWSLEKPIFSHASGLIQMIDSCPYYTEEYLLGTRECVDRIEDHGNNLRPNDQGSFSPHSFYQQAFAPLAT